MGKSIFEDMTDAFVDVVSSMVSVVAEPKRLMDLSEDLIHVAEDIVPEVASAVVEIGILNLKQVERLAEDIMKMANTAAKISIIASVVEKKKVTETFNT